MAEEWFRPRHYRHLDTPVGRSFAAKVTVPGFVAEHGWSPLISYVKREKRYKPALKKTQFKPRDIMYASHRDACILSYYAWKIGNQLDQRYKAHGLDETVIAYRSLGKSNYDFAAIALEFANEIGPCSVMCFDVTGFFDNLNHKILKKILVETLGEPTLPSDWFAVFKAVTRYRHISLSSLQGHPVFGLRLKHRSKNAIATMAEIKGAGIAIEGNGSGFGIPQGTPISAVLANLYMWQVDVALEAACRSAGALYQRYSDDILIVCPLEKQASLEKELEHQVALVKLELKAEKTERAIFDPKKAETFQYLGFNLSPEGAVLRPGSLGRQWRNARRSLRKTAEVGSAAVGAGKATKIYTKKLRRRFSPIGQRNFSSYARRAASVLRSKRILRQVRRLERMVDAAIRDF